MTKGKNEQKYSGKLAALCILYLTHARVEHSYPVTERMGAASDRVSDDMDVAGWCEVSQCVS